MSSIFIEQPPSTTEDDLSEYLNRMFILINIALGNNTLVTLYVLPNKPIIGKIYFFGDAIAGDPVITSEGFYGYDSTGYTKL